MTKDKKHGQPLKALTPPTNLEFVRCASKPAHRLAMSVHAHLVVAPTKEETCDCKGHVRSLKKMGATRTYFASQSQI